MVGVPELKKRQIPVFNECIWRFLLIFLTFLSVLVVQAIEGVGFPH